jgi:hypothetical protein
MYVSSAIGSLLRKPSEWRPHVYMYTYIHIHIHTYVHTYIHITYMYVSSAIGSLLRKPSEWSLEEAFADTSKRDKDKSLQNHQNIGTNRQMGANGNDQILRTTEPKSAADAKERGNAALASGSYDDACVLYSIGISYEPTR